MSESKEKLYCNFCGKTEDEVTRLVAGATANICDECALLAVDVTKLDYERDARSIACPGCGQRISMIAAVGQDQQWGIAIKPGPTGMLQAATVAGAIDGAQKLMRASCREDGANVQTYVESITTADDGTVQINFATLATSKKWAQANGRTNSPEQSQ